MDMSQVENSVLSLLYFDLLPIECRNDLELAVIAWKKTIIDEYEELLKEWIKLDKEIIEIEQRVIEIYNC